MHLRSNRPPPHSCPHPHFLDQRTEGWEKVKLDRPITYYAYDWYVVGCAKPKQGNSSNFPPTVILVTEKQNTPGGVNYSLNEGLHVFPPYGEFCGLQQDRGCFQ